MVNKGIFLGLGGNLNHHTYGGPRALLGAALEQLNQIGITITKHSPWYRSAPIPASDQPWFVNGVVEVTFKGNAPELLDQLLKIEAMFGRERLEKNAARTLDLDILAFGNQVGRFQNRLTLPHPRLIDRAFVLYPWADIAPDWRHPVTGQSVLQLKQKLSDEQVIEQMSKGPGLFGTEWPGS